VHNRPLSTTARSYTFVDERDAPAGRRVMTSLEMSQPAIPVNGGGLLVSSGQPFLVLALLDGKIFLTEPLCPF
ncbi:hypothetical protein Tco_0433651, partial [Tanacetum coccineum]